MRTTLSKITILLLLPLFLVTSVNSALGYSWCFGADGHVDVKYTTNDNCCSGELEPGPGHDRTVSSGVQLRSEQCGPCLDLLVQQGEAVFFKRLKKAPTLSLDAYTPVSYDVSSRQSVNLIVGNLASQPPPRISQTILAHRTVVLLN